MADVLHIEEGDRSGEGRPTGDVLGTDDIPGHHGRAARERVDDTANVKDAYIEEDGRVSA